MEISEIKTFAVRDRAGRELSDALTQDASTDAVTGLIGIEGRLKDPRFATLLASAPDMAPARQRRQLNESLVQYKKELTDAVVGNIDTSVRGIGKEGLITYLLDSPLKPAKYGGVTDDWMKVYADARETYAFLKDPEKGMPGRIRKYVDDQVKSLKTEGVSMGLISGVVWAYSNNPDSVREVVAIDAVGKIDKFKETFNEDEGRDYLTDRLKKLKDKDQQAEAYRIGQALAV
jgi:hypothetical protein